MSASLADNYERILCQISEGVVVTDLASGTLRFANPAARDMLGEEALVASSWLGETLSVGHWDEVLLPTGRVASVDITATMWSGEEAFLSRLLDITDRKKHESEHAAARKRMAKLAAIDPLTRLLNRRGLELILLKERAKAQASGQPLSAVLVDLDDFKAVNDAVGLAGGDQVLSEAAGRIADSLRGTDHATRIGGDEFLVLLPETALDGAVATAERIRRSLARAPVKTVAGMCPVTASLGVAELASGVALIEDVLQVTRGALAASKGSGKDCVHAADRGAVAQ